MHESNITDEQIMSSLAKTIGLFAFLTATMAVIVYAVMG